MRVGQLLLLLPLQHATILCVGFNSCTLLEAVLGIFQQLQIIKNEKCLQHSNLCANCLDIKLHSFYFALALTDSCINIAVVLWK